MSLANQAVLDQAALGGGLMSSPFREGGGTCQATNPKNISLYKNSDFRYNHPVPFPSGGALRIVT
jgi:hypothetical protein